MELLSANAGKGKNAEVVALLKSSAFAYFAGCITWAAKRGEYSKEKFCVQLSYAS